MQRGWLCSILTALALWGALPWSSDANAAAPDFEEDISIGMSAEDLRKFGAKVCGPQRVCLKVRWGEKLWDASFRQDAKGNLRNVTLSNTAQVDEYAATALEVLEEFAVDPVRVQAGDAACDAFNFVRGGKTPDQAVQQCQNVLDEVNEEPELTVWYIDEEQVNGLLAKKATLETAASLAPKATVVRFEVTSLKGVRVLYATFATLDND